MKEAVVRELHKPARKNFPRRHVDIRALDETWQADLVDMQNYADGGYKYILTVIDNFSKFAWTVALKKKDARDVTAAMESVLMQGRTPKNLHVDQGTEFYNRNFKQLMKRYGINLYSTYSHLKASICERFNRTLKEKMWMRFSLQGNYRWFDILQELVDKYNDTRHRTIGMKPKEVTKENEQDLFDRIYSKMKKVSHKKPKFNVGDHVRVSKFKHVFEKGYTPNWTTEIFTVTRRHRASPLTYNLKDYQGQPIAGRFYEHELQRVKYPDIYLVEKVLKRRGNQVYVKWLGFDNSHNSWIDKGDL